MGVPIMNRNVLESGEYDDDSSSDGADDNNDDSDNNDDNNNSNSGNNIFECDDNSSINSSESKNIPLRVKVRDVVDLYHDCTLMT